MDIGKDNYYNIYTCKILWTNINILITDSVLHLINIILKDIYRLKIIANYRYWFQFSCIKKTHNFIESCLRKDNFSLSRFYSYLIKLNLFYLEFTIFISLNFSENLLLVVNLNFDRLKFLKSKLSPWIILFNSYKKISDTLLLSKVPC